MTQENSNQNSTDNQGGSARLAIVRPFARFEDQYLMIPNVILDYLIPYCPPTAFMVLMVIYRKTFGWRKREDRISYSQIEQATGLSKATIWRALRFLAGEPDSSKPNSKTPEYKLINVRREPRHDRLGDDCYYSLNQTFELPVMLTGESDDDYWVDGLTINGDVTPRFKNETRAGLNIKPEPVQNLNPQKTNKETKDTGRTGIDSYIEAMLKVYNGVFNKRATGSEKLKEAAADLMLKGVTLEDYLEGCKRYQKNGTIDIRGPESIASWAINVKNDRERGVKVSKEPYQDANGNWHRE